MAILLWLLPAALVTFVAIGWIAYTDRQATEQRSEDELRLLIGEALSREHPGADQAIPAQRVEPSTGVVVRSSPSLRE
ncbi:MAG: hypothetical protein QM655_00135 [Nocardioidaceae bacterium]